MIVVPVPDIRNQIGTPTFSATGELISRPNGIERDAAKAISENALPIFSAGIVVCI